MRKFKLLKDLPSIPAGTVLTQSTESGIEYLYKEENGDYSGLTLERDAEGKDTLRYTVNFGVNYLVENLDEWLEEIKPEYKRWRAEVDETYFFVNNDAEVSSSREDHYSADNDRYAVGNYFRTREEAQAHADYLKALAMVRDDAKGFKPDWADDRQSKYYVCYLHEREGLCLFDDVIRRHADNGVFGLPYFETAEDAQRSIDLHTEQWKTIFGIKDKEEE